MAVSPPCELCNAEAVLFCPSDDAFLCRSCDLKVHLANFLVERHVRQSICSNCNELTGYLVRGVCLKSFPAATCLSCPPDDIEPIAPVCV